MKFLIEELLNLYINLIFQKQTKINIYLKLVYKIIYIAVIYGHYSFIQNEYRICEDPNYNNYYFKDKNITIEGVGSEDFYIELEDEDLNINSLTMVENIIKHKIINGEGKDFLFLLNNFKNNNYILEAIYFDYLDIKNEPNFFDNIKKLKGLKSFEVGENCLLTNEEIIKLLLELSNLKYLFLIDISFTRNLKLSEKEKERIYKLFPDMSIEMTKDKSCIQWENNNPIIKIK